MFGIFVFIFFILLFINRPVDVQTALLKSVVFVRKKNEAS